MPDHLDGTCCYTEDANSEPISFDCSGGYYEENIEKWKKKQDSRM